MENIIFSLNLWGVEGGSPPRITPTQWADIEWDIQSSWDICVVFQLDFADFYLEESDRCLYDSLSVLADVEGTEEIGRSD